VIAIRGLGRGVVLQDWKKASVTPVLRKSMKENPWNLDPLENAETKPCKLFPNT